MLDDLKEVIRTSQEARQSLVDRAIDVKTANAVAKLNGTIVTAHAIDLRERIFAAELSTERAAQRLIENGGAEAEAA